jgi:thioredoxin reductase (NADPH)
MAREEVAGYGVQIRADTVTAVCRRPHGFEATLEGGVLLPSRTLLIATGVVDQLPETDGMARFYGRGVFHCPYCEGSEVRDRPGARSSSARASSSDRHWPRSSAAPSTGRAP